MCPLNRPCILNMNKAQSRSITAMNVLTMCRHMQPTMWRCYFQEKQIKINTLPLPLPPPTLTQQQNRKKTKREKECVYCCESGRIVPKVYAGWCAPKRTLPPPPTMIFPIFSTQDKTASSLWIVNKLIQENHCTRLEIKQSNLRWSANCTCVFWTKDLQLVSATRSLPHGWMQRLS